MRRNFSEKNSGFVVQRFKTSKDNPVVVVTGATLHVLTSSLDRSRHVPTAAHVAQADKSFVVDVLPPVHVDILVGTSLEVARLSIEPKLIQPLMALKLSWNGRLQQVIQNADLSPN